MNAPTHNSKPTARAMGLGPSLMLAVTLIVLTSGGMSTARMIGSAGVGLALTVLPERAARASMPTPEVGEGDSSFGSDCRGLALACDAASGLGDVRPMARLGLIDLPPPGLV